MTKIAKDLNCTIFQPKALKIFKFAFIFSQSVYSALSYSKLFYYIPVAYKMAFLTSGTYLR